MPEKIKRVDKMIRAAKIDIQKLCKSAGVDRTTYYDWLRGDSIPMARTWAAFVSALPPKIRKAAS